MDAPPQDVVDRNRPVVIEVAGDTCDACPAIAHVAAHVYAELPSGRTLSMCAHHGTQHRAALLEQGARIIDMTHRLEP